MKENIFIRLVDTDEEVDIIDLKAVRKKIEAAEVMVSAMASTEGMFKNVKCSVSVEQICISYEIEDHVFNALKTIRDLAIFRKQNNTEGDIALHAFFENIISVAGMPAVPRLTKIQKTKKPELPFKDVEIPILEDKSTCAVVLRSEIMRRMISDLESRVYTQHFEVNHSRSIGEYENAAGISYSLTDDGTKVDVFTLSNRPDEIFRYFAYFNKLKNGRLMFTLKRASIQPSVSTENISRLDDLYQKVINEEAGRIIQFIIGFARLFDPRLGFEKLTADELFFYEDIASALKNNIDLQTVSFSKSERSSFLRHIRMLSYRNIESALGTAIDEMNLYPVDIARLNVERYDGLDSVKITTRYKGPESLYQITMYFKSDDEARVAILGIEFNIESELSTHSIYYSSDYLRPLLIGFYNDDSRKLEK